MVDIWVKTRAVSVNLECEACGEELEIEYGQFIKEYNWPSDWPGQIVPCPTCGHENVIDSFSFD